MLTPMDGPVHHRDTPPSLPSALMPPRGLDQPVLATGDGDGAGATETLYRHSSSRGRAIWRADCLATSPIAVRACRRTRHNSSTSYGALHHGGLCRRTPNSRKGTTAHTTCARRLRAEFSGLCACRRDAGDRRTGSAVLLHWLFCQKKYWQQTRRRQHAGSANAPGAHQLFQR